MAWRWVHCSRSSVWLMPARSSAIFLALLLAGCKNAAVYSGQCKQMLPGWVTNEHGFGILGIAVDIRLHQSGRLTFNREPVTLEELKTRSRLLGEMNPSVFVTFAADEGSLCEQVGAVRAIIDAGAKCNGDNRGLCGEGPGPWPVFGDVPPFPIVQEYKDGHYRWLANGVSDEEWLAANAHKRKQ